MKQQLLHTPEGVRDIYNIECRKKLVLQDRLHHVLHLYGYQDIQTPMFEFSDVFCEEIGTIPSRELYKFFDREGNTLVLRPDITPSVARAAATLFDTEDMPVRLCYMGNTFINHSSYQGRLKENTQFGAELIGIDSIAADAEMLALVVDALKKVGLQEFQVNIGHIDFFQSLIDEAMLDDETESRIRELIINRNYFGVEELLDTMELRRCTREAFAALPELAGGAEVLKEAKDVAPNASALRAVKRLEEIYDILVAYGVEDHISFDLSMSGAYGYYTGIIFRGYTFGTGDAIVKGGRYDHLMEKFGKRAPSIGFAIVVDDLMSALMRQKIRIPYEHENTLILYDAPRQRDAIALAGEFRSKGRHTELILKNKEKSTEAYEAYAKRNLAGSMLYLKEDYQILMVNLMTGERKVIG